MADDDLWTATDHDGDYATLHRAPGDAPECVVAINTHDYVAVHLTSEDLARLVRAAAPLAGLTVVEAEPAPEVDGDPDVEVEDRAVAVHAVWGGRRKGEGSDWLWSHTVDVAYYIATGEVPA